MKARFRGLKEALEPHQVKAYLEEHRGEEFLGMEVEGDKVFLHFDKFVIETRKNQFWVCPILASWTP